MSDKPPNDNACAQYLQLYTASPANVHDRPGRAPVPPYRTLKQGRADVAKDLRCPLPPERKRLPSNDWLDLRKASIKKKIIHIVPGHILGSHSNASNMHAIPRVRCDGGIDATD